MLLFISSSTAVPIAQRRDHNHLRIKPKHTGSEAIKTSLLQGQSRQNKAELRTGFEMMVLSLIVVVPFSVHAVFFDFLTEEVTVIPTEIATEAATDIELIAAQQNPEPSANRGGAELVVEENALISSGPVGADEIADRNSATAEIRVYTVREGDSLSEVAEMFSVTANTILWANDLTRDTEIQPGQTLVILPIAGVRHIVKTGDTITSIAKKYEGNEEEILSYNQLTSAADIIVGETLIIPGGELHAAPVVKETKNSKRTSSGSSAGFMHPAPGSVKTQGIHGYNAVDLAGSTGSTIRAAAAGEVIVAKGSGWNGGYGNYIVIKHRNGTQTLYAHLDSLSVGVGAYVEQGQTIGGMGNTGRSTGTHLHFEVRGGKNPF